MTHERLTFLLEAAADRRLTEAEAAELARLLENPDHLAAADQRLTSLKRPLEVLADYHKATRATEPRIPAERLETLLAAQNRDAQPAPAAGNVVPFRRWLAPLVVFTAAAACLLLLLRSPAPVPPAQRVFEFGVIASASPLRGNAETRAPGLPANWRVVHQENLATLRAWSAESLPSAVAVRIWIDEESGKIRALHRNPDGTTSTAERAIDTKSSIESQVRALAERLIESR